MEIDGEQKQDESNERPWNVLCDRIDELCQNLVDMKKAMTIDKETAGKEGKNDDVQKYMDLIASNILKLRQVHRKACFDTESLKEATLDAKVKLDHSSLQLYNLLYEKGHYEKEIRSCQSFQSKYREEELELVSEEEFLEYWNRIKQQAEEQEKEDGETGEIEEEELESIEDDIHKRMLARLRHELQCRKEKMNELEELKLKREELAGEVAERRGVLTDLESEVRNLQTTAYQMRGKLDNKILSLNKK